MAQGTYSISEIILIKLLRNFKKNQYWTALSPGKIKSNDTVKFCLV